MSNIKGIVLSKALNRQWVAQSFQVDGRRHKAYCFGTLERKRSFVGLHKHHR